MQLTFNYFYIFYISILLPWTIQQTVNIFPQNLLSNIDDLELQSPINSSDYTVPRDKRALGLLLQGLVQALGYNTTPIQLASLPNGNNGTNPMTGSLNIGPQGWNQFLPIFQNATVNNSTARPASPMNPRQQETLRFTGVVNFGNNSNLLSHLQQYEMLFHGTSTTPSPAIPSNAAPTNIAQIPSGQLPSGITIPYFAPIPIPVIQNLQYPKPLLPILTIPLIGSTQNVPNLVQPTGNDSNPPVPIQTEHPPINHNDEISLDDYRGEHQLPDNYRDEVEYDGNTDGDDGDDDDDDDDDVEDSNDKNSEQLEPETESLTKDDDDDDDGGDSKPQSEYSDYNDNHGRINNQFRGNLKYKNIMDSVEEKLPFNRPRVEIPMKYLISKERYMQKLPIDDKPFRVQLMNSYGQSLQHNGKVDESVADYFSKFKNPRSGVFEPLKPNIFRDHSEKLTSLQDDYQELPENRRNILIHLHPPHVESKYEEYKLNNDRPNVERRNKQIRRKSIRGNELRNNTNISETTTIPAAKKNPDKPFNIYKFNPYYKPIQYIFTPELSESNTEKIISYPIELNPNYNYSTIYDSIKNSREQYSPMQDINDHSTLKFDGLRVSLKQHQTDTKNSKRKTTIQSDMYDV